MSMLKNLWRGETQTLMVLLGMGAQVTILSGPLWGGGAGIQLMGFGQGS